ncbi:MAG: rod shape-determining protein [Thermodesulfobacteriota bacterium]
MLSRFKQFFRQPAVAIDLGTARTRLSACEPGIITEKPSVVRNIRRSGRARHPDPYIAYLNDKFVQTPLRGGVVVDVNAAVSLLKPLFSRIHKGVRKPVFLACAPTDSSDRERQRLMEAICKAGAAKGAVIPEPLAAAVGAGMDPAKPSAQMLVDIGEGVTDMAVFREGRIIFSAALRTACSDIHKALRTATVARHRVLPYPAEVERMTHAMGSSGRSTQASTENSLSVRGMDIVKGVEVDIEVSNDEIIQAMGPVIARILNLITLGLKRMPEDIDREISLAGICLTGGGSCINGLDRLLALETGHDIWVPPDPMRTVINGAVQILRNMKEMESWWETINWPQPSI